MAFGVPLLAEGEDRGVLSFSCNRSSVRKNVALISRRLFSVLFLLCEGGEAKGDKEIRFVFRVTCSVFGRNLAQIVFLFRFCFAEAARKIAREMLLLVAGNKSRVWTSRAICADNTLFLFFLLPLRRKE